jgi:hypothetical protein
MTLVIYFGHSSRDDDDIVHHWLLAAYGDVNPCLSFQIMLLLYVYVYVSWKIQWTEEELLIFLWNTLIYTYFLQWMMQVVILFFRSFFKDSCVLLRWQNVYKYCSPCMLIYFILGYLNDFDLLDMTYLLMIDDVCVCVYLLFTVPLIKELALTWKHTCAQATYSLRESMWLCWCLKMGVYCNEAWHALFAHHIV